MITELIIAAVVVVLSIWGYYTITGTPPGARVVIQEPPIDSHLDEEHANFMFFYATWCPHCKTAQQPWRSLQQVIKNNSYKYGGKSVTFEEVNAETDKGKSALYKIAAYPTFKLVTKDKVYEMLGAPNVSNFRDFLKKAIGDEKSSH